LSPPVAACGMDHRQAPARLVSRCILPSCAAGTPPGRRVLPCWGPCRLRGFGPVRPVRPASALAVVPLEVRAL